MYIDQLHLGKKTISFETNGV